MEMEIAGDKVTQRIIHDLAFSTEQLRIEMQQHITALDLDGFCHFCRCADGTDIRAGRCQSIPATKQQVKHRAVEIGRQIFGAKDRLRQNIHEIGNRPVIGADDAAYTSQCLANGNIQKLCIFFISNQRLNVLITNRNFKS